MNIIPMIVFAAVIGGAAYLAIFYASKMLEEARRAKREDSAP